MNFTDQGIKSVRETVQRADAGVELARQQGGSLRVYWTMGPYDLVAILEAPDEETATAFLLDIGSRGNIRSTTLRAYDRNQMSAILQRLG